MCNETVHKCASSKECCTKETFYYFDELHVEYNCISPAAEIAYKGLTDLLEDIEEYTMTCLEDDKRMDYDKYLGRIIDGGEILKFSAAAMLAMLTLFN